MGRKRNQGKARKAAKEAKAREEVEEEERQIMIDDAQTWYSQLQCVRVHGAGPLSSTDDILSYRFFRKIDALFGEELDYGGTPDWDMIEKVRDETMDEFADVWKDPAMIKKAMTHMLCDGVQFILKGEDGYASGTATMIRFLEQYIAIELFKTQALPNTPKLRDICYADKHTLVKFYRHRIPCSCVDEKYEEVKHITKAALCDNSDCINEGPVDLERSKSKYCSRCRNAVYCSRECQVEHWVYHKNQCDKAAEILRQWEADRLHNNIG